MRKVARPARHFKPEPRTPYSLDEVLAAEEVGKVRIETTVRMRQGYTSEVRSASRPQTEEVREALGVPKSAVQDWGRLSATERLDALATWLIAADASLQTVRFQWQDGILTGWRLRKFYDQEVPFASERVEWIWESLSYARDAFNGQTSPALHEGLKPHTKSVLLDRAQVDREVAKARNDDLAVRHTWLRRITRAQMERQSA